MIRANKIVDSYREECEVLSPDSYREECGELSPDSYREECEVLRVECGKDRHKKK